MEAEQLESETLSVNSLKRILVLLLLLKFLLLEQHEINMTAQTAAFCYYLESVQEMRHTRTPVSSMVVICSVGQHFEIRKPGTINI